MGSGKALLPLAVPVTPGIGGVSAPFSILPENLAGPAGALGQAVIQLITSPAAQQKEAAEAVALRFEDATHSFALFIEASGASQLFGAAAAGVMRQSAEQAIRFFEDLSRAKGPLDALSAQLGYMNAQAQLFVELAKLCYGEFARLLCAQGAGLRQ